jgi:hypothetical protein
MTTTAERMSRSRVPCAGSGGGGGGGDRPKRAQTIRSHVIRVIDGDTIRVYGGPGNDSLSGTRVFGALGDDALHGEDEAELNRLRGGPGADSLSGPGWLYGGPGDDFLEDAGSNGARFPDMLVGGLGRDQVELIGRGRTVVRLRGGGADSVNCLGSAQPSIVLYVDRSDRINPRCRSARILLTERPRYPPFS